MGVVVGVVVAIIETVAVTAAAEARNRGGTAPRDLTPIGAAVEGATRRMALLEGRREQE